VNRAKPFCMAKREVWEAYKQVKAHRGAAGIDGQSIDDFERDLSNNLYRIWNRMCGSYFSEWGWIARKGLSAYGITLQVARALLLDPKGCGTAFERRPLPSTALFNLSIGPVIEVETHKDTIAPLRIDLSRFGTAAVSKCLD
jgi:hypothetical protein